MLEAAAASLAAAEAGCGGYAGDQLGAEAGTDDAVDVEVGRAADHEQHVGHVAQQDGPHRDTALWYKYFC